VRGNMVSFPFNLHCGTPQHTKTWVAAWVYSKDSIRSQAVRIALTCTP
jgi:hypothetical protein